MTPVIVLAAIGVVLSMAGYALMRADAASASGYWLLGCAIAFVGVMVIFIAAARAIT